MICSMIVVISRSIFYPTILGVALGGIQVGIVLIAILSAAVSHFIGIASAAWKHVQVNEHCRGGLPGCAEPVGHKLPLVTRQDILVNGIPVGTTAASNKEKGRAIGDCRSELESLFQIICCCPQEVIIINQHHHVVFIKNSPVLHEAEPMLKISTAVLPTLPPPVPPTTTTSETGDPGPSLTGPQAKPVSGK